MNDFYVERYPDIKLVIALTGSLAQIDIFGPDYHKAVFCRRDEVPSVKADLIYSFRRKH